MREFTKEDAAKCGKILKYFRLIAQYCRQNCGEFTDISFADEYVKSILPALSGDLPELVGRPADDFYSSAVGNYIAGYMRMLIENDFAQGRDITLDSVDFAIEKHINTVFSVFNLGKVNFVEIWTVNPDRECHRYFVDILNHIYLNGALLLRGLEGKDSTVPTEESLQKFSAASIKAGKIAGTRLDGQASWSQYYLNHGLKKTSAKTGKNTEKTREVSEKLIGDVVSVMKKNDITDDRDIDYEGLILDGKFQTLASEIKDVIAGRIKTGDVNKGELYEILAASLESIKSGIGDSSSPEMKRFVNTLILVIIEKMSAKDKPQYAAKLQAVYDESAGIDEKYLEMARRGAGRGGKALGRATRRAGKRPDNRRGMAKQLFYASGGKISKNDLEKIMDNL